MDDRTIGHPVFYKFTNCSCYDNDDDDDGGAFDT